MDAYCERVGPGLLAEPLNAVSNVSFLLAAWAAWVLATHTGALSAGVRVLIALAASVGIGSILWHTYPTSLTLILDIVPILFFIIWYIWLYTRNVIGMRSLFAVRHSGGAGHGERKSANSPRPASYRGRQPGAGATLLYHARVMAVYDATPHARAVGFTQSDQSLLRNMADHAVALLLRPGQFDQGTKDLQPPSRRE